MEVVCSLAEKCELECKHKKPHTWSDLKGCGNFRCEAFHELKGAEAADFPAQMCVEIKTNDRQ